MKCSICLRVVLVAWPVDGQDRAVCDGCIRRMLKQAERVLTERIVLERWRRMGFS